MSILRSKIWNVRERVISSKLNQQQAIAAVNSQDAVLSVASSGVGQVALPVPFVGVERRGYAVGLEATLTGNPDTLDVQPGVLLTWSPSYPAPTPGEAFSPWRMYDGSQDPVLTLPVPIPGVPTWYLLEARVGMTTINATRSIRSLITGLFAPQVVPDEQVPTLETQWKAGAPGGGWPAPTGGEWVAIALVQRAGGGGVIAAADVYDVRQRPADVVNYAAQAAQNRQGVVDFQTTGANTVALRTQQPPLAQGLPLEAGYVGGGIYTDLDLSTIVDTSTPLAASTVFYLYLAPYFGLAPRNVGNPYVRGRLVLSSTPPTIIPAGNNNPDPTERVWVNSGNLADPGPGGTVWTGEGILIGSFARNSTNTGFVESFQTNRRVRLRGTTAEAGRKRYTQAGNTIGAFLIPLCAQVLDVGVDWTASGANPVDVEIVYAYFGGAAFTQGAAARPVVGASFGFQYESAFDGPDPTLASVLIVDSAGAIPATYQIDVTPRGYTW